MSEAVKIPKLLTVKQLAAATGLPTWRIHELSAQGKLPYMRVGRTLRFAEDRVVQWITEQSTTQEE